MKKIIHIGIGYGIACILLAMLVTAVDRFDESNECFSDGDCPDERPFCRQTGADQRWQCFAAHAQVGQFCVDPDDCDDRRCIDNRCHALEEAEAPDGEGGVIQTFIEAINRIKAAILPDARDLDVEWFLSSPTTRKASAVAIVKSGDKLILAKRENSAIDRSAISTIKYQQIDINVCLMIDKNLAADDRELVNCRKDAGTGSNFVKTATSDTKLWHQLVSLVQLR